MSDRVLCFGTSAQDAIYKVLEFEQGFVAVWELRAPLLYVSAAWDRPIGFHGEDDRMRVPLEALHSSTRTSGQ